MASSRRSNIIKLCQNAASLPRRIRSYYATTTSPHRGTRNSADIDGWKLAEIEGLQDVLFCFRDVKCLESCRHLFL